MSRHRNNSHQQLQQLQNQRTLMSSLATRPHPYNPNINSIHEDELADGRNIILGMLTRIKELYQDVINLTEERNQLKIDYAVLQRKTSELERRVTNFQEMEQQRQRAEEDKRKVVPVQSAMKRLTLHLGSSKERYQEKKVNL